MRLFILIVIVLCYPLYATELIITSVPTTIQPTNNAKQAWAVLPNKADPVFLDHFVANHPQSDEAQVAFTLRFNGVQTSRSIPHSHAFIEKYAGTLAAEQALYELFDLYREQNTLAGYFEFLQHYPNTLPAIVAKRHIEWLVFELLTQSDSEIEAALLKNKAEIFREKRANHLAAQMEKAASALTAAKNGQSQYYQRLVRRYCYLLNSKLYQNTKAVERCRLEAQHQRKLKKYEAIRQAFFDSNQALISALKTEFAQTRQTLREGFERLHLDHIAWKTALDKFDTNIERLHQDFVKINHNLTRIHQALTDIQETTAQTHQHLLRLHENLAQVRGHLIQLNQEMNQGMTTQNDLLRHVIGTVTQNQRQAIINANTLTRRTIEYQTHVIVYNTDRRLVAEQQTRGAISQLMEQFLDEIDPAKGCGNAATADLVPDQWIEADFYPACQCHDKCYATCGKKQAGCDDSFYEDLKKECHRLWLGESLCLDLAKVYHFFVSEFGQDSWKEGQTYCAISNNVNDC